MYDSILQPHTKIKKSYLRRKQHHEAEAEREKMEGFMQSMPKTCTAGKSKRTAE